MTSEPRAFVAIDSGSATRSASLVGRVGDRWRLLGSLAAPSTVPLESIVELVVERVLAADPALASTLVADGGPDPTGAAATIAGSLRQVTATTGAAPRIAVVAATDRTLDRLTALARSAGWETIGMSVASADALAIGRLLLARDVDAILAGSADPPGGDERGALPDLAALLGATAQRRPERTIVLAGGLADQAARVVEGRSNDAEGGPVLAPAANVGDPPGEPLRALLDELAARAGPGRRTTVRAVAALAAVLDRSIEAVDIGRSGGLRIVARPGPPGAAPTVHWAVDSRAALVPSTIGDEIVDGVLAWSVVALDRHRMRDRLRELRDSPWGEPYGDGALLRLAAARAAVARLVAATRELDRPTAPDLVLAIGGAWAVAPGPAIALALSDVLRRPGASQLAYDHARLLGPLGAIVDPGELREVIADLADDLLAPLGGVVVPAGLRPGRTAGRLVVHAAGGSTELDLVPGGLELVDLPPGSSAVAELQFRDQVSLGTRGRRFALELGGGLGGLLIDLRDVPLRLPDRLDRRRELLGAWQQSLWAGLED
ncbi:MAG TPA: hypothetical protein VFI28_08295 [Candidatus Limnocylindrales bacterium]|nr:hypothetical protein [Candidatus Limnocylindrales bacterium]